MSDEITKAEAIAARDAGRKIEKALKRFLAAGNGTVVQRYKELRDAVVDLDERMDRDE